MRYLITGHTGFKGAWLALMLRESGHEVSGIALDPLPGSLFALADLSDLFTHDLRVDIRDASATTGAIRLCDPEVVLHLAAQPLVRDSYREPRATIETNVMGTFNVLEATQDLDALRARVIVTTDKVYRNVNRHSGYEETEPLGGDDPYSASKAMADLLTHAWTTSFDGPPTAIARAGNVVGGGDASPERLLPDVISALEAGVPPRLRYPAAVRPWQHVLDCLEGYLTVTRQLLEHPEAAGAQGAWNFGPEDASLVTVGEVTTQVMRLWGAGGDWVHEPAATFHEAGLLALDSRKATSTLGWRNRLDLGETLRWTVDWYRAVQGGADPRAVTLAQIGAFRDLPSA